MYVQILYLNFERMQAQSAPEPEEKRRHQTTARAEGDTLGRSSRQSLFQVTRITGWGH